MVDILLPHIIYSPIIHKPFEMKQQNPVTDEHRKMKGYKTEDSTPDEVNRK